MNTPKSWSSREEQLLLLNAYLDNELDAASALDIERRLANDTSLKAEYDRLAELRTLLGTNLSESRASDEFRRRITAIPEQDVSTAEIRTGTLVPSPGHAWRKLAMAAALAGCIASGGTYLAMRTVTPSTSMVAEIVAGHQRALLGAQPFDVASSDRHTVKPWFDGRLALSPLVMDLSAEGFPLVGGRVDMIGGEPVPTTVYKRREHLISLVAVPSHGSIDDGQPATDATLKGYEVRRWSGRDFSYAAVSDVAEQELDEFVKLWREQAKAK